MVCPGATAEEDDDDDVEADAAQGVDAGLGDTWRAVACISVPKEAPETPCDVRAGAGVRTRDGDTVAGTLTAAVGSKYMRGCGGDCGGCCCNNCCCGDGADVYGGDARRVSGDGDVAAAIGDWAPTNGHELVEAEYAAASPEFGNG